VSPQEHVSGRARRPVPAWPHKRAGVFAAVARRLRRLRRRCRAGISGQGAI